MWIYLKKKNPQQNFIVLLRVFFFKFLIKIEIYTQYYLILSINDFQF